MLFNCPYSTSPLSAIFSTSRPASTAADTGFIAQNVYLFCASENLSTVVMGGIDRARLSKEMGLLPGQKVILVQPVGYPKPEPEIVTCAPPTAVVGETLVIAGTGITVKFTGLPSTAPW